MNQSELRDTFQNLGLPLSDVQELDPDSLFPGVSKWHVLIEAVEGTLVNLMANAAASAVSSPLSVPIEFRLDGKPSKLEVWNVRLVSGVSLILSATVEPKPLTAGELDIRATVSVVSDQTLMPFVEELAVEGRRIEAIDRLRAEVKGVASAIESLLDGVKQPRATYIYRERLECTAMGWARPDTQQHAINS